MLALLPHLLSHSNEPIATVVHIGAGVGSELETYQNLACEKIVAIEPDAALFKKLSTKARRFSNVETSQTWIGEKSTKAEAQIFANPRFNSLLSAGTLLEYFANLSQPKITEVNTLSLSDFFSTKLTLDRRKQNILVIEVQGFEVRLLQACEAKLLQQFSLIIVRTSAEMLYKDGANAKQLTTFLNEKLFDLMLSDTSHLPYVEHYYRLDHSQITLTDNQKENAKQQQLSLEQINHLSEQLVQQTQVLTGIQGHEKELQQSLVSKNEKLTSLSAQLAQENEKVGALQSAFEQAETGKSALQAQCGELTTIKTELENQLSHKAKELTEQAQKQQAIKLQAEVFKTQIEKLTTDRAQQHTHNEQLTAQVTALQTKQNELVKGHKNKDKKIAELTEQRDAQAQGLKETKQRAEALKTQNDKLNAESMEQENKNKQLLAQVTALQTKHNELAESQKNKDGQLAELTKERDQQAQGLQETKQRAEALKTQNDKLSAQSTEQQTKQNELAESQKNKDAQIAELTKQQAQVQQENKLRGEVFKTQIDKLNSERVQQQTENEQLAAQVSSLQAKHNELVDSHKHKDAQILIVTTQRDKETHWHQENKKWAEGLQKQLHDKSNSFEHLQSQYNVTSSLSSKMLLKVQLDLDNLRSKYQLKVDSERQLLALVKQLREKLEMAANYYFRLQKDYPELVEKDVPDSVGHK